MKVKLTVSGGFIPVYKEAEVDSDLSDRDWDELISTIALKPNPKARDKKEYTLEAKGKSALIDQTKFQQKHPSLCGELLANLKPQSI